jgi:hypothetical protein
VSVAVSVAGSVARLVVGPVVVLVLTGSA